MLPLKQAEAIQAPMSLGDASFVTVVFKKPPKIQMHASSPDWKTLTFLFKKQRTLPTLDQAWHAHGQHLTYGCYFIFTSLCYSNFLSCQCLGTASFYPAFITNQSIHVPSGFILSRVKTPRLPSRVLAHTAQSQMIHHQFQKQEIQEPNT